MEKIPLHIICDLDPRAVSLDMTIKGLIETITITHNSVNEIALVWCEIGLLKKANILWARFIAFQITIKVGSIRFCRLSWKERVILQIEPNPKRNRSKKIWSINNAL